MAGTAASLLRFAVVGLGSAGMGRVRVLSNEESKTAGFELKAVVSRRPPPEDIAHLAVSLEDVIAGNSSVEWLRGERQYLYLRARHPSASPLAFNTCAIGRHRTQLHAIERNRLPSQAIARQRTPSRCLSAYPCHTRTHCCAPLPLPQMRRFKLRWFARRI